MKGGWRRGREDDEFNDYDDSEFESGQFESGELRSDMTASDEIDSFGFAPADFDDDEDDEGRSTNQSRSGNESRNVGEDHSADEDLRVDGSSSRSDIDFTDADLDDRQPSRRYSC